MYVHHVCMTFMCMEAVIVARTFSMTFFFYLYKDGFCQITSVLAGIPEL